MAPLFGRRSRNTPPAQQPKVELHTAPVPVAEREEALQRLQVATAPFAESPRPVLLADRYRIGDPIGSGGMATVYAARDLVLGRDVAIKVFRERAGTAVQLQLQEAEAHVAASLNHYALATLFDAGVTTGVGEDPQVYLVMEHVHGSNLKTRLRDGPLEVLQACWLGFDLAEALEYVHQSGILHRDIKPANVLLSPRGGVRPMIGKLADFGIASLIGQPDNSEFTTGTAAYLSPEQVEGLDAGTASDIYSLGLVLLEAFTGQVEYPGGVEESAFARLDRDPRIPATIPLAVGELLRGMTALRPEDRTALHDVALGLQRYIIDDVIRRRTDETGLPDTTETARLAALHRYNILDTEPDDTFDTITRLASNILDAPISLITLIDADRAWIKSGYGWDAHEVDRDVSFCSSTAPVDSGPWTIPDALADPRTRTNPFVLDEPRVRSYAAAPLITHDGHNLGALCVFDQTPRDYTPRQLTALSDLARLAMHEMETRLATRRALFP